LTTGADVYGIADALPFTTEHYHITPLKNDMERIIVNQLRQQRNGDKLPVHRQGTALAQLYMETLTYGHHPRTCKQRVDYREYPTTREDTLCHHDELFSLPFLDEKMFSVRSGPTRIPNLAPIDDGLFMIGNLTDGTILCPVHGTRTPSE
jgi:hypothetical protein